MKKIDRHRCLALALIMLLVTCPLFIPCSAYGAGTPAGTVIASQATVSFYYGGDPSLRRVSSNIAAITVAQVVAINLAPATGFSYTRLNTIVDYPFSLVNSGNGTDRFSLTLISTFALTGQVFVDANGDGVLNAAEVENGPVTQTSDIHEDRTINFVLRVSVGDSIALAGKTDVLTLTSTSNVDPSKHATLSRSTNIMAAIVQMKKSVDRTAPRAGDRLMYTIELSNSGNARATEISLSDNLDPRLHYVAGSAAPPTDTISGQSLHWRNMSVPGSGSAYIMFMVDIANNVAGGTEIHNVMAGQYLDGTITRTVSSTETNFMTIQSSGFVTVDLKPDTAATGEPGDTLRYGFLVSNYGSLPEEFDLGFTSTQGLPWVLYEAAEGGSVVAPGTPPISAPITLSGGAQYNIVAQVVLPPVANDQVKDFTTFRVQSTKNPLNFKTASGSTTIGIPRLSFTKTANATNPLSGSEITYTITYVNAGHGGAYQFAVTDSIPANTAYVPQSAIVNGVPKTDEMDGDEFAMTGGVLTVNIGNVMPNGRGTIAFRVRIL